MVGNRKLAVVLALAALIVGGAAGCGGDDSSTPSSSTQAAPSKEDTTTAGAGSNKGDRTAGKDGNAGKKDQDEGNQEGGGSGSGKSSKGGEGSGSSKSGSGSSSSPEDLKTPGGDNSIQNLGHEASDAEREAASDVLEAYLQARESGDQETACANMAKIGIEQLEDLSAAVPEAKGKGCVAIFVAIDKRTPKAALANPMAGPVGSLRIQGGLVYALFRGKNGSTYAIRMAKEGTWGVAALAALALD